MQLVGPKCNILLCKYIPQPQECGSLYNIPVYNASQWSTRDPYSAIKNQSYATFSLNNCYPIQKFLLYRWRPGPGGFGGRQTRWLPLTGASLPGMVEPLG